MKNEALKQLHTDVLEVAKEHLTNALEVKLLTVQIERIAVTYNTNRLAELHDDLFRKVK